MSRTVARPCRAPCRSPSSGRCAARRRRRHLVDAPAGAAARTTISSGQPKRRSAMPSVEQVARRAARIGPRSRRRRPVRRRSSGARARLASAGVQRPAPAARRPGAEDEVGRAGHTGSATARQLGRVEEPSASMKQTTSAVAAQQPGEARGAEPAPRARHDARAERRGDLARCRRSSRCRRRSRGSRRGMPAEHPGSASASSSTGRMTSGIAPRTLGARGLRSAKLRRRPARMRPRRP